MRQRHQRTRGNATVRHRFASKAGRSVPCHKATHVERRQAASPQMSVPLPVPSALPALGTQEVPSPVTAPRLYEVARDSGPPCTALENRSGFVERVGTALMATVSALRAANKAASYAISPSPSRTRTHLQACAYTAANGSPTALRQEARTNKP
jgi:hypothetical protein